jgi:O-antigen/teichoic acid export membrane protein
MGLKNQAINGVLWSSVGKLSSIGIEFIVGIILARLLTPKEFGLIGTIMVVIALSQVFINSGFSQALIRKQNCTQSDYSTAFFFNLCVGLLLYLIIIMTSGAISRFYNKPELKPLIEVLGIGLIISSFTLIQSAKLIKRIDFKLQTKISVIASLISGTIAVLMALKGFGVWSLVIKSLTSQIVNSLLLWTWNRWKPNWIFSVSSFKELFNFGSKLLISGLIGTFFNNIYYIVIGKYFSAPVLGFYTRAELFINLPSQNISDIITSVGYPVLAKVQNEPIQLKSVFKGILTTTFFIISILMFGLAAVSHSLVLTLIGEQWKPVILYMQILCFFGLIYPLNSINVNLLNVVGRSDIYLKLQLVADVLRIPVIVLGVILGIKFLILGVCFNSIVAYIYFSNVSSKFSGYKFNEQLFDIFKPLLLGGFMGIIVFLVDYLTNLKPVTTLMVQITVGAMIVFTVGELFRLKEYVIVKSIFVEQYRKFLDNLFSKK